jgi:hypothetical protein
MELRRTTGRKNNDIGIRGEELLQGLKPLCLRVISVGPEGPTHKT